MRDSTDKVEELEEKNKKLIKTGEELRTNFNAMRQDRNDMKKELEVQREQTMRLKEKVATMEAREVEGRRKEGGKEEGCPPRSPRGHTAIRRKMIYLKVP